jgi:transposase
MDIDDGILDRVEDLIKDNYDTKSIKNIISNEFGITESQSASYIKRVRKQLGLFKPNSGKVSNTNIDEDEDTEYQASFKKVTSKYNYRLYGNRNYF